MPPVLFSAVASGLRPAESAAAMHDFLPTARIGRSARVRAACPFNPSPPEPTMKRLIALSLTTLLGCGLAACSSEAPQQAASSASLQSDGPADVAPRIAQDLKTNNLLGAVQAMLPPDAFAEMKKEYEDARKEEPSDEDRAEFATMMAKFTEADAEAKLAAELEPLLQKFETEMAAQLPFMVAMGQGFAQQWLQEETTLTEAQKAQASGLLTATGNWLQSVKFADRELARQAIARTVETARALELKTLDEARALSFEDSMGKFGIAFAGAKDVLALYGLKIDDALGSVNAKVVSEEGDQATVAVSYRLFDQPLEMETSMIRQDGRWYGKDALESIKSAAEDEADAESDEAEVDAQAEVFSEED